jgi:hypothetical protein
MDTIKRNQGLALALALLPALALGACSGPRLAGRSDRPAHTLAAVPAASDVPGARERPARPQGNRPGISEETLRDPAQRQAIIQRIVMQLVRATRDVPADRYQREVRPRLDRQLREAGFAQDDVDFILADVDGSRPGR